MTPRLFRDGLAFAQVTRVVTAVRCRQPKVLDWHAEVLSTLLHYWPVFAHSSALERMTLPPRSGPFWEPFPHRDACPQGWSLPQEGSTMLAPHPQTLSHC